MIGTCAGCATPLGSRDRVCPGCGVAVRTAAGTPARRAVLVGDTPVPGIAGPPAPVPPRRAGRGPRAAPAARLTGGPAATGTVTGEVTHVEVAAVGRREVVRAVAAGALAAVALAALLLLGGDHRGRGLLLLLPTLAVTALLVATPFLVPASRALAGASRFHLVPVSGDVVECELLGAPTGPPPRTGETLEVFGRGTPVVRVDEIVRGEERIRGRPPFPFVLARHAPTAAFFLSAACAVLAGVLVMTA